MKLITLQNLVYNTSFLLTIVFCILPLSVNSLRCGICSSGNAGGALAQLKSQFPKLGKIPKCGTGSGEEEQPLALECPADFQAGCLTQTKAKQVVKMCSSIPVHDCKSANGVEYCYCRGNLCNIGGMEPLPPPVPIPTPAPRPIPTPPTPTHFLDDEDDSGGEGSGGGVIKTKAPTKSSVTTLSPKPTKKTPTQSSKANLNSNNVTGLAIFYLLLYISQKFLAQY